MEPSRQSELLRRCVGALSKVINLSTGISHPSDESRAKELFIALHERGVPIGYDVVYPLLLESGLAARHANFIAELAQSVSQGKRVVVKHRTDWGVRTIDRVIAESAEPSP